MKQKGKKSVNAWAPSLVATKGKLKAAQSGFLKVGHKSKPASRKESPLHLGLVNW